MTPWQAAADQLAGLLKMRDEIVQLAKEHEAIARDPRHGDHEAAAHGRYAERLRALLPTRKTKP